MREYAKVSPQFWVGATGKAIRKLGPDAQIVALYLMTSPHSNMMGLYHLPITYIHADTGIPLEGAYKALQSLSEADFCTYDEASEMVWVHEMAIYQIAESLDPKDKQVSGINKAFKNSLKCQQLRGFWLKYKDAFHLDDHFGFASPIEGPSKALPSKEKEQEQEKEQDAAVPKAGDSVVPLSPEQQQPEPDDVAGNTPRSGQPDLNPTAFAERVAEIYGEVYGLEPPPVPLMITMGISQRIEFYESCGDLDWWRTYFEACRDDLFLTDRKSLADPYGRKTAGFKHLVSEECIAGMIERSRREAAHG